jgi:hypothetical protein
VRHIIPDCCRYCTSHDLEVRLEPEGSTHHARLICLNCDRFLKWLPRPAPRAGDPPPAILALCHPRARGCVLVGSERQCRFGRSIRERMMFTYAREGRGEIVTLLKCITSAAWFIANSPDRRSGPIRWPAPSQMEPDRPRGECPCCGSATWGAAFCCFECADAMQAAELRH